MTEEEFHIPPMLATLAKQALALAGFNEEHREQIVNAAAWACRQLKAGREQQDRIEAKVDALLRAHEPLPPRGA